MHKQCGGYYSNNRFLSVGLYAGYLIVVDYLGGSPCHLCILAAVGSAMQFRLRTSEVCVYIYVDTVYAYMDNQHT